VIVRARNADKLNRATSPLFQSLTDAMTELDARYTTEERALIQRHLQDTIAVLRREITKVENRG
jgi:hypothetical protein